jgi:hypothetical protein
MQIRIQRQVSVSLENRPGQLAAACRLLADHGINIEAVSVIDSLDHGVIRLMTSDPTRCKQLLSEHGFHAIDGDVLVLDVADKVGTLAELSQILAEAKINIDYVYGSVDRIGQPIRLVLKTSDLNRAYEALARS